MKEMKEDNVELKGMERSNLKLNKENNFFLI